MTVTSDAPAPPPATDGPMPACVRLRRWWTVSAMESDCLAVRERIVVALAGIDLASTQTLEVLCAQLGRLRGRRVVLLPLQVQSPQPAAMWWRGQRADYVIYTDEAVAVHRLLLALHGLGHILLSHRGDPVVSDEATRDQLFHGLDPELVKRSLSPWAYTDVEEREAEWFATWMLAGLGDWKLRPPGSATEATSAVLRRLIATLEHRPKTQGQKKRNEESA